MNGTPYLSLAQTHHSTPSIPYLSSAQPYHSTPMCGTSYRSSTGRRTNAKGCPHHPSNQMIGAALQQLDSFQDQHPVLEDFKRAGAPFAVRIWDNRRPKIMFIACSRVEHERAISDILLDAEHFNTAESEQERRIDDANLPRNACRVWPRRHWYVLCLRIQPLRLRLEGPPHDHMPRRACTSRT